MNRNLETEQWYLEKILSGELTIQNNKIFYNGKEVNSGLVNGYMRCYLYPEGRGSTKAMQVHRLMWMFEYRSLIPEGLQINHDDGVKTNNVMSNFELATNQQNVQHAFDIGLARRTEEANIKAVQNNPFAIFSDDDVRIQRELYKDGKTTIAIVTEKFSCSTRTASNMLLGITYGHVK